jgi:hypothetical protein
MGAGAGLLRVVRAGARPRVASPWLTRAARIQFSSRATIFENAYVAKDRKGDLKENHQKR